MYLGCPLQGDLLADLPAVIDTVVGHWGIKKLFIRQRIGVRAMYSLLDEQCIDRLEMLISRGSVG